MYDLLIKDATLLVMDPAYTVHTHYDLAIQGNKIAAVAPTGTLGSASKVINAAGQLALPGLVNTHTHIPMSYFKGTASAMELFKWLAWGWFYIQRMDLEDIYWASRLACLEMTRAGVTTFCDQYFYVDHIARAVEESGLRACISEAIMEPAPGMDARLSVDEQISYARNVYRDWNGKADGRIQVFFAPHSLYTCSPPTVEKILAMAGENHTRLHIHLSETRKEVDDSYQNWGMSPPERMQQLGVLDYPVIAAHCVHLSEKDIDILDRPTFGVAHNPASNLKLQSGRAPIEKLVGRSMAVGIGSDGNGSNDTIDILKDVYLTTILHPWKEAQKPAHTALALATREGARALGMEQSIGTLEIGKQADVILVKPNQARMIPVHEPHYALALTSNGSDVTTTVVAGRVLMENKQITNMNEKEVLQEANERAGRIFSESFTPQGFE
jgi:5-methylthioadenosine/S-adenosylhomocysteine deaminase